MTPALVARPPACAAANPLLSDMHVYLTSDSLSAINHAGAYPFLMVIFGLIFICLFVTAKESYLKWADGIIFLAVGFACMQDVNKIRRKKKKEDDRTTGPIKLGLIAFCQGCGLGIALCS